MKSSVLLAFCIAFFGAFTTRIALTQQVSKATADEITWKVKFTPQNVTIAMDASAIVELEIRDINNNNGNYQFQLQSENARLATVDFVIPAKSIQPETNTWIGNITIVGVFLGETQIYVERINLADNSTEKNKDRNQTLDVIIIRSKRAIDYIFTGSVALLVSLLYINFGAALDLQVLRGIIRRPVGPIVGLVTQFLFMPLLSYGLGLLLFPDSIEMQLGLFFTGVSPSGGASNIWTVVLGGNINLSVLMTSIGNFAAFGTIPLWIFTLGKLIFERGDMEVPYMNIATIAISLIVPLVIGLAIQYWSPRTTRWLVRLLKPISMTLLLFIIIFAIITNLYIFELFSWQIVLAGLSLPWLGYLLGWILAKSFRQNSADALTIAIETGIQNTGISIFLLRFSLQDPQADLTTVIPVAVAIMTPFPLLALYIYRRCANRNIKDGINEQSRIIDSSPRDGRSSDISSDYNSNQQQSTTSTDLLARRASLT